MSLSTYQYKHIEAWQLRGLSQVAYCRQPLPDHLPRIEIVMIHNPVNAINVAINWSKLVKMLVSS